VDLYGALFKFKFYYATEGLEASYKLLSDTIHVIHDKKTTNTRNKTSNSRDIAENL